MDYRSFTAAFVEPRDERIAGLLAEQLATGAQWPDPWLSLNPNFASGGAVSQSVNDGLLHRECEQIFRLKDHENDPGQKGDHLPPPSAGCVRGGQDRRVLCPDDRDWVR